MSVEEKAKAAKNAYQRNWAKKNPERVKAIQMRYWTKMAEKMGEGKDAEKNES